jgi:NADH:ubiquinone oxidoreductase subunit E
MAIPHTYVQLVKIYMPCNFEVNLGVIALFSSFFSSPGPKGHVRYCHHLRCFLPSLAPFCQAVSEEKIVLNSNQSETRIALGGHICWWNGTKWRNFIEDFT